METKRENPTPSSIVLSPSRVERKVMCVNYRRCLDKTVKRGWSGFSCRKCSVFYPLELDEREWLADSLACIALIHVVEYQDIFKQKPRGGIVLRLLRGERKAQWLT